MKMKKCVWCGKLFEPNSPRQTSCKDDHYRPCAICGKPLLIKESYKNYMKNGPRTCPECRKIAISRSHRAKSAEEQAAINEKRNKTNLERYGNEVPLRADSIKAKSQETLHKRYGVDNISQLPEIQEKIRKNSELKYGVSHYSNDPEIRKRMTDGMITKYGVKSPLQSDEIKSKMYATNLERYGAKCVFGSEQIQEQIKSTCLSKYGVEYAAQASEIVERRIQTNLEKYGAPGYVFSSEFLKLQMTDPSKSEICEKFRKDPSGFILSNYLEKPTYKTLSEDLGISETSVSYHVCKHNCQDLIRFTKSNMENEVVDFLESLDPSINIIRDVRSVISPYELDIYIPEAKFAIECNPTASHNSDVGFIFEDDVTDYKYHRMKTDRCIEAGIQLLHLFGYDWTNHKDIMKSIIRNRLGHVTNRYYARKLTLKEVPWKEASAFLIENHRQGYTQSKVRLGLYDSKDGLVSLMTFGKLRSTQGKRGDEDVWELSRFCSKLNCQVVGGASKLFHHFLKETNCKRVVSFSDRATTSGKLYEVLGFSQINVSDPSYVWVDLKTDKYYHRVSCQKRNLKHLLQDNTIDIDNSTEVEIMTSHGYARVFDSGTIRWEYIRR